MKVTIDAKAKTLTITVPITPAPSKSGKMILLANTGGFRDVNVQHEGKPVKMNLSIGVSST